MKTVPLYLDNLMLIVREGYVLPHIIPSSCGSDLSERLIPESFLGLSMSLACHIHDDCFQEAEPLWEDFHISNNLFIRNMVTLITTGSRWLITPRLIIASQYFEAVDTVGKLVFKSLKRQQGYLQIK